MVGSFYYSTIDVFFNVLHIILILINCFGWAFKKTLKLNLILLLLTISSWCILGYFFGLGFCVLTKIHFHILNEIETTIVPFSYLDYIIIQKFDLDISSKLISTISLVAIFISLMISMKKNFGRLSKLLFILTTTTCFFWIIIINQKGIGFFPNFKETYVLFTLLISLILITKISFNIYQKDF